MGCAGSTIEAIPVTVDESGLSIIDEISIKTIETTGLDLSLETGINLSFVDKRNFLERFREFSIPLGTPICWEQVLWKSKF